MIHYVGGRDVPIFALGKRGILKGEIFQPEDGMVNPK